MPTTPPQSRLGLHFLYGALASAGGLLIAGVFFRQQIQIVATFFTSMALIQLMNRALNENRIRILELNESSIKANVTLTLQITLIFVGIFSAALIMQGLLPDHFLIPITKSFKLNQRAFSSLFIHNAKVLAACMVVSLFYRAGGLLLVISWNALHWSVSVLVSFVNQGQLSFWESALAVGAILPHLILEASAYIMAGMAGVFLSKALLKYRISSTLFSRVARAAVLILLVAIGVLFIASLFECYLAYPALTQILAALLSVPHYL